MGAMVLMLILALGAFQAAEAASTWLGTIASDVPTRIGLDSQGNIYVTEARDKNLLRIFDRQGKQLNALSGLSNPAGVAVDGQGQIYIANMGTGSVDVYTPALGRSFSLGKGKGEFKTPHSVAVARSGMIYVSDSNDNRVKVYNPNGTQSFSFGGYGQGNGQFNVPLALAIDEGNGELYVLDWGIFNSSTNGPTAGARVQVFDLSGKHLRSFGEYGTGEGKMIRPLDMGLDKDSRVYVADGYQGVVHVFNSTGVPAETIFDPGHPTKTPIGLAVGRDSRVFIASNNQKNVEIFGMTGYTTLSVAPLTLAFSAARGTVPAGQAVSVTNSGSGVLEWTASASPTWITLSKTDATTLTVGLASKDFAMGSYSGAVTVTAASGATETVAVSLTVTEPPAVLNVTPANGLAFKAQQNGPAPAPRTIDIRNLGGGILTWTASKSADWLSLNAATGTAPSSILAAVTTALPVGTHTDTITIAAAGAVGSPVQIPVSVTVTDTGTLTITTNLAQAKYSITGPAPSTAAVAGTGTLWKNEEAASGEYSITFGHVSGYKRPQSRTVTVATGKETAVTADYAKKAAATHIVAAGGPVQNKVVTVLTAAGDVVSTFKPFSKPETELSVSLGDLDGNGTDEIVVSDGDGTVKAYSTSGAELAVISLSKPQQNGLVIAVGDLDNDGRADVLVGSGKPGARQVERYGMVSGKFENKGTILSEEAVGGYRLAVGDINGDLANELVVADAAGVRVYGITGGEAVPGWSMQGSFEAVPAVAAGDLDDDGAAEIVLSVPGAIQVLKGTGEPAGVQIATQRAKGKAESASVTAGDLDGDGADEIAAATAAGSVQVYEGDGSASGAAIAVPGASGPVGVSLGRL